AAALVAPHGAAVAAPQDPQPKGTAGPSGPNHRADEEAIRKASADYAEALSKGDLNAVLGHWAPDADYIDETGKVTRGRDAIGELFRQHLPEIQGTKATVQVQSVKSLRPDIALEDGTLELTSPDGTRDANRF